MSATLKIGLHIILLLGRGIGSNSKKTINTSGVGSCKYFSNGKAITGALKNPKLKLEEFSK